MTTLTTTLQNLIINFNKHTTPCFSDVKLVTELSKTNDELQTTSDELIKHFNNNEQPSFFVLRNIELFLTTQNN
jgi:hypothetical protein